MIENNDILKKDFMILWSNYLLTDKMDMNRLTALAELGQIDAICEYYLMSTKKNPTIGKIVDDLPANNPINVYTKNCKFYSENKKELDEIANSAKKLYEGYGRQMYQYRVAIPLTTQLMAVVNHVHSVPHYKERITCAKQLWKQGKADKNPVELETAVEINASVPLHSEFNVAICSKAVKRRLKNACKENPNDMELLFNLAKNLTNFNNSEKNKEIAKQLLSQISANEYSETLEGALKGKGPSME